MGPPRALSLAATLACARHLAALAPGLRQTYRNCLFAAGDSLTRPPGAQCAVLALVHRPFDLLLRFLTVLRHLAAPFVKPCVCFPVSFALHHALQRPTRCQHSQNDQESNEAAGVISRAAAIWPPGNQSNRGKTYRSKT